MYKYLERFAQLGGFIENLTESIHKPENRKIEEPAPNSKSASKDGGKEDKKDNQEERTALDEPLFVDPNNTEYLKRDPANLTDDEKGALS
jgi:hypothetical protein